MVTPFNFFNPSPTAGAKLDFFPLCPFLVCGVDYGLAGLPFMPTLPAEEAQLKAASGALEMWVCGGTFHEVVAVCSWAPADVGIL